MEDSITRAISRKILRLLRNSYGEPEPGLTFHSLYEIAISVVLSAQTTDRQVNSVTPELFARYPDFPSLASADRNDVERIIRSTGFYRTKAGNIISLSDKVCSDFGGRLPENMDDLLKLPGIGRKSANVIISMGFNKPGLAVDTHVSRVSRRLGYTESKNPSIIEKDLCRLIPPSEWKSAHLLLIAHGRNICRARQPECGVCVILKFCRYGQGITSSFSNTDP